MATELLNNSRLSQYPLGNSMPCHGEDFATSVARTVADQWPSRDELRTRENQERARAGLPEPGYREAVEPKHVAKKLAKLDPTEKEIYGYTKKDGTRVPGLTHEVRTQGFMRLLRDSDEELASMTEDERAELAAMQEQSAPFIGPLTADAARAGLVQECVPEFFPPWKPETFIARRRHDPGDFRQRCPEEVGVELRECSEAEMMWGLN